MISVTEAVITRNPWKSVQQPEEAAGVMSAGPMIAIWRSREPCGLGRHAGGSLYSAES